MLLNQKLFCKSLCGKKRTCAKKQSPQTVVNDLPEKRWLFISISNYRDKLVKSCPLFLLQSRDQAPQKPSCGSLHQSPS